MTASGYTTEEISIIQIKHVFDELALINTRPRDYLGGVMNSDSFAALVAYLTALEYSPYYTAEENSLKDFKSWLYVESKCPSAQSVYIWLEGLHGPEEAFAVFFDLVEKYKMEKGIKLSGVKRVGPPV